MKQGLGFSSYKPNYQEIKYLVYAHCRTYSTYFCVKAVFTRRNSLALLEHNVITKEAEAAVLLRTPLAGLVSGVEIKLWWHHVMKSASVRSGFVSTHISARSTHQRVRQRPDLLCYTEFLTPFLPSCVALSTQVPWSIPFHTLLCNKHGWKCTEIPQAARWRVNINIFPCLPFVGLGVTAGSVCILLGTHGRVGFLLVMDSSHTRRMAGNRGGI